MEGDVDARDGDEGARVHGSRPLGESGQAGPAAGDGVLLPLDVVVDDLQEFPGVLRDLRHVVLDLPAGDADHVGAQCAHAEVGAAVLVAFDEGAHGGAAGVDDVDDGLEVEDVAQRGERGVLAEGVPGVHRVRTQGVGLAQTPGLGVGDDGERDLGELRQVQHTRRVPERGAADGQFGRVLVDDPADGEAELRAGVLLGPVPDLAGRGGGAPVAGAHAHGLDALAGVDVGGPRLGHECLADGDDLAVDAAGDLDGVVDALAADALDGDLDGVAELHHAVHGVGPADDGAVPAREVLGGGGQPHAVDQRGLEVDQPCGVGRGVDRVVVAGDQREGGHVGGGGDHGAVDEGTRGRHHLGGGFPAAPLGGRGRHLGSGGAAADREALHLGGHEFARREELQLDGDDASRGGLGDAGAPGGDVDGAAVGELLERDAQVDDVVEVHGVEQALDDGVAVGEPAGAERGVDRRPAGADQHVRGAGFDGAEGGAGDGGVRGEQFRGEGEGVLGHAERRVRGFRAFDDPGHGGDAVAVLGGRADAGQALEEREDGVRQAFLGDDRGGAGGHGVRQVQRDGHLADVEGALLLGQVVPVGVRIDADGPQAFGVLDEVVGLAVHLVGRVGHEVAVPHDGRGGLDVLGGVPRVGQAGVLLLRLRAGVLQGPGGAVLEAAEQVGDGLVLPGDAGDGHRARDDADLVGGVALVLGLPQGVLAEPHRQVPVERRDPRHGFDVLAVEVDPPGGVARGDLQLVGLRVGGQQPGRGGGGVVGGFHRREERGDLAVVGLVQAGLDAVQEVEEAVVPGGIDEGVGQFHEAVDPLRVGHLPDVAEVGLGGPAQDLDDLVAAGVVLGEVQRGDETGGGGEGVVQLVDVGEQVGLRGCRAVVAAAAGDPAVVLVRAHPPGVDQQLLDRVGGRGLFGGHGDGADEHGVDGHFRQVVFLRPAAGEVLGGAFGGVDAAADGQQHVGVPADLGVGLHEHVVEVGPGVVAASVAVLDLHEDVGAGVGGGDLQRVADLLRGARFEGDVGEAVGVQLREQLGGLFDLGDAGGDGHAVEGGARGAGLGHDAGLAELQVPQEAVEEHGVELCGAARFQLFDEPVLVVGEDLVGVHAAAGEFGPVAGVGGRGDDAGVRRGRGHPAEHDRREAGDRGEAGLGAGPAVRQADQARGEVGVVGGGGQLGTRGGQPVAFRGAGGGDQGDAGAGQQGSGQARQPAVEAQHVPGALRGEPLDLGGPIMGVGQDGVGQFADGVLAEVDAAALGPLHRQVGGRAHAGVVEGGGDGEFGEGGGQFIAAEFARFDPIVVRVRRPGDASPGCGEFRRGAGEDVVARAVDHGQAGGAGVLLDDRAFHPADREHPRAGVAGASDPAQRRAEQYGEGERLLRVAGGHHTQGALGVAEHRPLCQMVPQVAQVVQGGDLPQDDAGDGDGGQGVHGPRRGVGVGFDELREPLEGAGGGGGDFPRDRSGGGARSLEQAAQAFPRRAHGGRVGEG